MNLDSVETNSGYKTNILIVDDKPSNLMVMEEVLAPLNVSMTSVTSGEDALSNLLHSDFDLVLMDVQMPHMDGFETAELIHNTKKTQGTPIIFISAVSTNHEFIRHGYELGAVDYITKPIDPLVLRSKVDVFVNLQKINHKLQDEISGMHQFRNSLIEANETLRYQAETDYLTGLQNRRKGNEILCKEMSRVGRGQQTMSLIMIDVDHFKKINDTFGHDGGDAILLQIAERLRSTCRTQDVLARWGGEEFLVICPHTDTTQVQKVATRILQNIYGKDFEIPDGPKLRVSVSIGTSSTDTSPGCSAEGLLTSADDALYEAKNSGRNCIRPTK